MITEALLTIDIRSYWHPGSGKGSGSHLDAIVERDQYGLPFVSGRMIKGLLRDALNRRSRWQHLSSDEVVRLFGSAGYERDDKDSMIYKHNDQTSAGLLRVSDATLPEAEHNWLALPEQDQLKCELFSSLFATAIEAGRGVAKKGSLRGKEVVIPMRLEAKLEVIPEYLNTDEELCWLTLLKESVPLITAIGANRNRGFGRAVLSLKKVAA